MEERRFFDQGQMAFVSKGHYAQKGLQQIFLSPMSIGSWSFAICPVGAEVSLREQSINKVMELGAYKLKLRSGHSLSLYMLCVLNTERISLHVISSRELRT